MDTPQQLSMHLITREYNQSDVISTVEAFLHCQGNGLISINT